MITIDYASGESERSYTSTLMLYPSPDGERATLALESREEWSSGEPPEDIFTYNEDDSVEYLTMGAHVRLTRADAGRLGEALLAFAATQPQET